jgi:hypothetical protein
VNVGKHFSVFSFYFNQVIPNISQQPGSPGVRRPERSFPFTPSREEDRGVLACGKRRWTARTWLQPDMKEIMKERKEVVILEKQVVLLTRIPAV